MKSNGNKNPEGVKTLRIVRCKDVCGYAVKIPQDGAADIKNDSDIETCMQWPACEMKPCGPCG